MAENSVQNYTAIIGELVRLGYLSEDQVSEIFQKAAAERRTPLRVMVDARYVTEKTIYDVVAQAGGFRVINPDDLVVDSSASKMLEATWAKRLQALPYAWEGSVLLIAVPNPTDLSVADDLRRLVKSEISLTIAAPDALTRKIGQVYRAEEELDDIQSVLSAQPQVASIMDLSDNGGGSDGQEEAPIIRYVNLLIAQAVSDRASDIHLEPTENELDVRYRIDGVLHPQASASKNLLAAVVSRIKIMANIDIAERRVPQDGRMTISLGGRKVDLRVATLPTVYGEKVVMRILDNSSAPLDLADVGISQYHRDIYANHYHKPHGMILVTGPTGSGKSTTLYATLNTVVSKQVNIITVEDPVEYRMNGISQIQINNKAGLTFAVALRSILRSDPDIILVGEIRDQETAQIAVEAALTGHMVFTTLHTNDATSAVTRLVEMGIEPYLVGSALSLVVAQRLLRKLCDRCAEDYSPTEDQLLAAGYTSPEGKVWEIGDPIPTLRRAVGCEYCTKTGYRGRTAIHEMMEVTREIEKLANEGAHSDEVRRAAIASGMRPIRNDGWDKVTEGITSIEEVLRVSA